MEALVIVIKDLEKFEELDQKSMATIWGAS